MGEAGALEGEVAQLLHARVERLPPEGGAHAAGAPALAVEGGVDGGDVPGQEVRGERIRVRGLAGERGEHEVAGPSGDAASSSFVLLPGELIRAGGSAAGLPVGARLDELEHLVAEELVGLAADEPGVGA